MKISFSRVKIPCDVINQMGFVIGEIRKVRADEKKKLCYACGCLVGMELQPRGYGVFIRNRSWSRKSSTGEYRLHTDAATGDWDFGYAKTPKLAKELACKGMKGTTRWTRGSGTFT